MTIVHLHLLLNHFPVVGMMLGILLFAFSLFRKSEELKKASLGLFVFLALITIPVYLTGEPAEESVENLSGVSKSMIEDHETAAAVALGGIEVLGVISLVGLFLFRRSNSFPNWIIVASFLVAFITAGIMAWAGNLGGQIRHTEIYQGTQSVVPDMAEDEE